MIGLEWRSGMAKTVTFWPCLQPFNSFCFETLFFKFYLFPSFLSSRKWEDGGRGRHFHQCLTITKHHLPLNAIFKSRLSKENHMEKKVFVYWQKWSSRCVLQKKGVLKNFARLTGKHLCQGLLFNKVAV